MIKPPRTKTARRPPAGGPHGGRSRSRVIKTTSKNPEKSKRAWHFCPPFPKPCENHPVPPSDTPESVAGEVEPVPRRFGQNAGRISGAVQKRSPSRLQQAGACLSGTQEQDRRLAPGKCGAFRDATGTDCEIRPRASPWKRCRHPLRGTRLHGKRHRTGHVFVSLKISNRGTRRVPTEPPRKRGNRCEEPDHGRNPPREREGASLGKEGIETWMTSTFPATSAG